MSKVNGNRGTPKYILVAGGAGFLGSHLCEFLVGAGHWVYCVDNLQTGSIGNLSHLERDSRFTMIEADVAAPLRHRIAVDQIYNLACPASPRHYQADPVRTMMTSVAGAYHLLEHARCFGASYLQASTSEVYGDPEEHPQREEYWGHVNPTGPRACYDEGKRAAETLCFDYLRKCLIDVRVARIFNTYGPRMRLDDGRIVSNFVTQALKGEPLTVYGDGKQTRSFCYVSDLIGGLVSLMEHRPNPGVPINLGHPSEVTVMWLARQVLDLTKSHSIITHKPLPVDDPQRRRPDIARARDVLGWHPRVSLADGLPPTVAWFSDCLADVNPATGRQHIGADPKPIPANANAPLATLPV
jgi:UDP-glucuronate decarboxylase